MDNRMLIMAALVAKAASGDVAAIREVRCISEETDKAREAEQKQRTELLKAQTERTRAETKNGEAEEIPVVISGEDLLED